MDAIPQKIGFIGAGQMATALAAGWIRSGMVPAGNLLASDVVEAARQNFEAKSQAKSAESNDAVLKHADVLFLAIKPQSFPHSLPTLIPKLKPDTLIVSIAAGVTIHTLASLLGAERRIVRVMPNTPCLVGESATGIAGGPNATEADVKLVEKLFNAVGKAYLLPERLLDAVCGLSGSGPAYGFVLIEALSDGGVKMGLPRDVATALAAQTLLGAAKMVLETGQHPGILKDAVASPAGTTIAGLHELEKGGVRAALINAVQAATHRSLELGK